MSKFYLPPEKRQIVLIGNKELAEKFSRSYDWVAILKEVNRVLNPLTALIVDYFTRELQKKNPSILFPYLSPEEAKAHFRFDFGHPIENVLYVLNPCFEDQYLLPATAGERFIQEKIGAFLQIAAQLGAKQITIISGQVDSSEAGSNVKLKEVSEQIGLSASFKNENQIERQSYAEFNEPTEPPHISDDLMRWCDNDPFINAMVKTRLSGRIKKLKTTLKLTNSMGLQAKLLYDMGISGINLGGNYKETHSTSWELEIEFF